MIKKQGEVMMYARLFLLLLLFYFQREGLLKMGKATNSIDYLRH